MPDRAKEKESKPKERLKTKTEENMNIRSAPKGERSIDGRNIAGLRETSVQIPSFNRTPRSPRSSLTQSRLPRSPANNTFKDLPFPSAGERIKANDFRNLSQSLTIIYDTFMLSSCLLGARFGEAKLALASQQYEVQRVMSVFGTEIDDPDDESLDDRKIIQVVPMELGERRVCVILTEAVETRRFTPNLIGLTYGEASERLNAVLGDVTFPSTPFKIPQMVGLTLADTEKKNRSLYQ